MKWFRDKFRIIILALTLSTLVLAAKFLAYLLTHSNIIFSDALESIVNVVASGFASFSIYLALQPKDANHPYGHGKVEFFAAGIEGLLILIAGVSILLKSVYNFFEPQTIRSLDWGLTIIIAASLVNFFLGRFLVKKGNEFSSITLVAEGKHLLTDNLTTVVGIAGIIIVRVTDIALIDNLFSFVLSLQIIRSSYRLIRPSVAGLMDEMDDTAMEKFSSILNKSRQPDWIDIHNMRIAKYGADIHIDCHLTIPFYYSLKKSNKIVHDVETLLSKEYPQEIELFIQADPCIPELNCQICQVENCNERIKPFVKRLEWNTELLIKNKTHTLEDGK